MPAIVGADAAEALGVSGTCDVLLDRTAGNAKRRNHSRKGQLRIPHQEIENEVKVNSGICRLILLDSKSKKKNYLCSPSPKTFTFLGFTKSDHAELDRVFADHAGSLDLRNRRVDVG